ncbi:p21-activated protein kinase-interacting protein 1-like [Uranotaenia lowii]|uniref:p21-activated protein kinase-interacting protein 1-like n=1 Tax=Uranotaenia lowii TaxID=190385 RepID=UPI002479B9C9|nr:p21-activated protein kinase-interacting protein 1-like [Uranotaenia lowii]
MAGLEIIVGTYEEYTAGYKAEPLKTDASKLYLKEIFSTHNHTASVRVLATYGNILASGGADDRICLFDLETGTLKDELIHHNGTINCLVFSNDGDYLFSGSHDGTISAVNMKKLAVEKTWKNAHKSAVLSISIHPHGKIALSLGSDMTLRTWDLVTGRAIYTRGLKGDPKYSGSLSSVEWSPDGTYIALMGARVVDIVSMETAKSVRTVKCSSKPACLTWISETELACGLDDGNLLMFDAEAGDAEPEKFQAYESRLKSIAFVGNHLATASSAGDISLWKIEGNDFQEICTTNIGCRPTCLVLVEADLLGLHKYLKQLEDNKDEIRQQLRKIRSFGSVTVEHEDPLQEQSEQNGQKVKGKKKKRPLAAAVDEEEGPVEVSTPISKKQRKLLKEKSLIALEQPSPIVSDSASKNLLSKKKRKRNNGNTSTGVWIEEDFEPEAKESTETVKVKKSKKGLNQTVGSLKPKKKKDKRLSL